MSASRSAFKPVVATAGIMLALSDVLEGISPGSKFSAQVVTPTYRVASLLGLIGAFVLALAVAQLHIRQADRIGRGGLVAALAAGFGVMLLACVNWSTSFVDPAAAKVYPAFIDDKPPAILVAGFFISLAWFGLSFVAYAVVMLRSGAFPRVPVVLMLVGALASATPVVPFSMTLFALALAWLGLAPARVPLPKLVPAT